MAVAQKRPQARLDGCDPAVLVEHRQAEARAEVRAALAYALEEAEVLGEAVERDVLAVVRRRLRVSLALGECLHRAAECRARLMEDDFLPRVHELERGGEAREPAADDRHLQRKTPRATTASFSGVESRVLP